MSNPNGRAHGRGPHLAKPNRTGPLRRWGHPGSRNWDRRRLCLFFWPSFWAAAKCRAAGASPSARIRLQLPPWVLCEFQRGFWVIFSASVIFSDFFLNFLWIFLKPRSGIFRNFFLIFLWFFIISKLVRLPLASIYFGFFLSCIRSRRAFFLRRKDKDVVFFFIIKKVDRLRIPRKLISGKITGTVILLEMIDFFVQKLIPPKITGTAIAKKTVPPVFTWENSQNSASRLK